MVPRTHLKRIFTSFLAAMLFPDIPWRKFVPAIVLTGLILVSTASCQEGSETSGTPTISATESGQIERIDPTPQLGPTTPPLPHSTRAQNLNTQNDFLNYSSPANLLSITFPRTWTFTDFQTLFVATDRTLIDNPGFQTNESVIMILSDQNNEVVRQNAQADGSVSDLLNSFILSEELNQYGANYRLLEDIQLSTNEARSTARATLSTIASNGETGLVFLTAFAEADRRALVVTLAVEASLGRYANSMETITNSLVFDPSPLSDIGSRPTLPVNGIISGNWTDGPAAVDIILQANVTVLAVLTTAADSDGVLVLENSEGTTLRESNFAVIGQPEAMRIEVPIGERFILRIRERTRSLGQFQIFLVNLAQPSLTLVANEEREVIGQGTAEYVFQPLPGASYLIYVEPLGPEMLLQDPAINVVDIRGNLLAEADNGYLSEPEVLLFNAPDDVSELISIQISDFFGKSGNFRLHLHQLIDEEQAQ